MQSALKSSPSLPSTRRSAALPILLVLTVGVWAAACRRQPVSTGSPAVGLEGVYTLTAVGGKAVPASVSHGGTPLEIRSGSMTFDGTGGVRSRMVFVPPGGREVVREVDAVCTRSGAELTLRWKGAGTTWGVIQGNEFVMTNEGMALSYRK